jgi:RNA polymerase sigma factor (sigma-70 family)
MMTRILHNDSHTSPNSQPEPRYGPPSRPVGHTVTAPPRAARRNENIRSVVPPERVSNDVGLDRTSLRRASPRSDEMSDAWLLAGLASNSPDVVVAFVRRFQSPVFRVAFAVLGDRGLAEDVAQQTFERAWRRAATFDPDRGTVRAWLLTIARNLAIDTVRVRTPMSVDPADLVRLPGSEVDDPEHQAIRAEVHSRLRATVRRLPPAQARAVVMAGVYEMSAQEVAVVDDIALGTAKTRIRAAKIKLREDLCTQLASNA